MIITLRTPDAVCMWLIIDQDCLHMKLIKYIYLDPVDKWFGLFNHMYEGQSLKWTKMGIFKSLFKWVWPILNNLQLLHLLSTLPLYFVLG